MSCISHHQCGGWINPNLKIRQLGETRTEPNLAEARGKLVFTNMLFLKAMRVVVLPRVRGGHDPEVNSETPRTPGTLKTPRKEETPRTPETLDTLKILKTLETPGTSETPGHHDGQLASIQVTAVEDRPPSSQCLTATADL